ncbi:MAG TPA: 50S ribosomal protein L23 [Firmicutes bacterium]|jgi:large subunit ribosomal protein L23|nr:50S ribosomal protein L23 [Bacillota bacterium]HBK59994.1 50S ribosomal protein L23 [Bacillota bacterium]
MAHPQEIIIKPIVTEKSTAMSEESKYVFEVKFDANKVEIAKAVEVLFKVTVVSVNTMRMPGKLKRQGRSQGMSPQWKKAIVTLKSGDRIPLFEGA